MRRLRPNPDEGQVSRVLLALMALMGLLSVAYGFVGPSAGDALSSVLGR